MSSVVLEHLGGPERQERAGQVGWGAPPHGVEASLWDDREGHLQTAWMVVQAVRAPPEPPPRLQAESCPTLAAWQCY